MIREIVDHLAAALDCPVEDLFALGDVATEPKVRLPAVFVVPDSEVAADAAQGTQIFEQLVTTSFAVVVVVGADAARRGQAASRLEALEAAIEGALIARVPDGFERPIGLVDTRLASLSGGRAARVMRFRTVRRIRRVLGE
jgi:hypothetical protein